MPARPLLLLSLVACAAPDDDGVDSDGLDTEVVDTDVLPACPAFDPGVSAGTVASDAIGEASGIVASRAHPGTYWVHNDSGGAPRVYAVGADGADLGGFDVTGASALDWEDLAIAPDGDGWSLLLADIGDNVGLRPDVIFWRVPEPDPASPGATAAAEEIRLSYPDGPHDAETVFVDPRQGDLYVVSKVATGSHVYRAAAPLVSGATMEDVATIPFGVSPFDGDTLATGGDLSPGGDAILIRTYFSAFLWRRTPHASVADALAGEPCPVPLASELQGEAIAFTADGVDYVTVAEDLHPTLWRFARR